MDFNAQIEALYSRSGFSISIALHKVSYSICDFSFRATSVGGQTIGHRLAIATNNEFNITGVLSDLIEYLYSRLAAVIG